MKIGVLTSSRADYGIYMPLLQQLKADNFFKLEIIAFGTHLSKFHGFTVSEIEKGGFETIHTVSALICNDDAQAVATAYALTALKFADFWAAHTYDYVLCLGDRFEMSAAVQAGIPFGVRFAHLHGGETTLGAIDNIYRHQISLAATLHFTATEAYTQKIIALKDSSEGVFAVGSLSLDDVMNTVFIEKQAFYTKFNLPQGDFALVTFHPETVNLAQNSVYPTEMQTALAELSTRMTIVITMPNADTQGTVYRDALFELKKTHPETIILIENFGKINYFSAMHHARLLIGNTSSGILEAASFGKYVVNVGDRQKGRLQSANTLDAKFSATDIIEKTNLALQKSDYTGENIYYKTNVTQKIIETLKKSYAQL